MENATKALLICAGILLAIMIISIVIFIYQTASATVSENATLDQLDLQTHNSKYELLRGVQPGSKVKIILEYAIQDNEKLGEMAREGSAIDINVNIRSNDEDLLAKLKAKGTFVTSLTTRAYGVRFSENIREISRAISNTRRYNIWYSYTDAGYIWEVHIDSVN